MPEINYFWDEIEDNVVREYDENNNTLASYTTEPTLYGSVLSQDRGGEKRYHHFDGQGNATDLTDESGSVTDTRRYQRYGTGTSSTGTTPLALQFRASVGMYHSAATALLSMRPSVYTPQLGAVISEPRWLSRGFILSVVQGSAHRDTSITGLQEFKDHIDPAINGAINAIDAILAGLHVTINIACGLKTKIYRSCYLATVNLSINATISTDQLYCKPQAVLLSIAAHDIALLIFDKYFPAGRHDFKSSNCKATEWCRGWSDETQVDIPPILPSLDFSIGWCNFLLSFGASASGRARHSCCKRCIETETNWQ